MGQGLTSSNTTPTVYLLCIFVHQLGRRWRLRDKPRNTQLCKYLVWCLTLTQSNWSPIPHRAVTAHALLCTQIDLRSRTDPVSTIACTLSPLYVVLLLATLLSTRPCIIHATNKQTSPVMLMKQSFDPCHTIWICHSALGVTTRSSECRIAPDRSIVVRRCVHGEACGACVSDLVLSTTGRDQDKTIATTVDQVLNINWRLEMFRETSSSFNRVTSEACHLFNWPSLTLDDYIRESLQMSAWRHHRNRM